MLGKVRRFNKRKGFGFISTQEGSSDIFFYYKELIMEGFKTIKIGAEVEFELVESPRGLQAKNIQEIKKAVE